MEGHSSLAFPLSNEVAVHASKMNACFERASVGIWNPCLMDKPVDETYNPVLSNKGVLAPPCITTVDAVNGAVQVPVFRGTPKSAPAYIPPTAVPDPSYALRGSPFAKERNFLSSSIGGIGPDGMISRTRGSCQAQINKFAVQLSEVCQRRFVMFDRSGTKRRMIVHPAIANEFPALVPSSLPKSGVYNSDPASHKASGHRDTTVVVSPFLTGSTPLGPSYFDHHPHLLLKNTLLNSHSSASDNCDTPLSSNREHTEAKRKKIGDGSPEPSGYSHENTEDIEALLSSDEDEASSTGHSPSDLTRNKLTWNSYSSGEGHSMCASKKRKRKTENLIEDEDTCSTASSGLKMCKETIPEKACDSGINTSYGKEGFLAMCKATHIKDLGYGKGDLTAFDMFFSDEVSSRSSANNKKWDNKLPSMRQQQHQQQQQQEGQSRKDKIKSILRLLRGVVPGGESMDTAFVLDEAIQYVKTLQFEVQKLQARKLT